MVWPKLSLLARISLVLSAIFTSVLAIGIVFLLATGPKQLREEEDNIDRLTVEFVRSSLTILETSSNPERAFDLFLTALRERSDHMFSFRRAGSDSIDKDENKSAESSNVPEWFAGLLRPSRPPVEIPVTAGGREIGQILYRANMSADIYEKWITFLAMVLAAVTLTVVSVVLAHIIIAHSLSPLAKIEQALGELRAGNYLVHIACEGPPELENSCRELNDLASRLHNLSSENRELLRRIVVVQDDERKEVSRELHDELGPLLFAIRANATSLKKALPPGKTSSLDQLLAAAEAVQDANRRILEKLRPMDFRNIGLARSLESLADGMRSAAPSRQIDITIDPAVEDADETTLLSTYRVVQEGLTNAMRHTQASKIAITCDITGTAPERRVTVCISDNGGGIPTGVPYGRGLTGMKERLSALGGTFSVTSENGHTFIHGSLPYS